MAYVGHWSSFAGNGPGHAETEGGAAAHVAHCHYGAASCSQQQQVATLSIRGVAGVVELAVPDLPRVQATEAVVPLQEFISATPTEPPRTLTS
jgi:hypothetical protein